MTSFITEATRSVITASSYRALSASAGVIAILLLVVLLAQKEVVRAIWPSRSRPAMRKLDVAIVPLLMAFALIFAMRLVTFLVGGLR